MIERDMDLTGGLSPDDLWPVEGMETPDGHIQMIRIIAPDVYWIDTGSHEFLLLPHALATRLLTPQASHIGEVMDGWIFFEEDCAVSVPLIEHPEWLLELGWKDYHPEQIAREHFPGYFDVPVQLILFRCSEMREENMSFIETKEPLIVLVGSAGGERSVVGLCTRSTFPQHALVMFDAHDVESIDIYGLRLGAQPLAACTREQINELDQLEIPGTAEPLNEEEQIERQAQAHLEAAALERMDPDERACLGGY